jgi:hypothetical protein
LYCSLDHAHKIQAERSEIRRVALQSRRLSQLRARRSIEEVEGAVDEGWGQMKKWMRKVLGKLGWRRG